MTAVNYIGTEMCFIVDGSKALFKAIRASFGRDVAIQRCQIYKVRNIMERLLPKSTHAQVADSDDGARL